MAENSYSPHPSGTVLCILHGLPRTVKDALPIFMQRVVKSERNLSRKWSFDFVVHSEGITTDLNDFLGETLNNTDLRCQLKRVYTVAADPSLIHNSNDAYCFRLYDTLRREELDGSKYDIIINCRLDVVPTTDVPLELFSDNFTIISGEVVRSCVYHHRDWDLMTIGNSSLFKMYHYLVINTCFLDWKSLSSNQNWPKLYTHEFDGTDNGWAHGLNPGAPVSPEDHLKLEKLTGMRSEEQSLLFDNIILNIIRRGGKFFFSDAHTQIYAKLIREHNFSKAYQ